MRTPHASGHHFFENIDHARSGEPDPIFGDLPLSFSSTES